MAGVASLAYVSALLAGCAGAGERLQDRAQLEREERQVCAGISDDEARSALLGSVERVEALREATTPKAGPALVGAVVYVRAAPGVTEPWLRRLIECHLLRHACASELRGEGEGCPHSVEGVCISVSATPTGFAIFLRARGVEAGQHLLDRAAALGR